MITPAAKHSISQTNAYTPLQSAAPHAPQQHFGVKKTSGFKLLPLLFLLGLFSPQLKAQTLTQESEVGRDTPTKVEPKITTSQLKVYQFKSPYSAETNLHLYPEGTDPQKSIYINNGDSASAKQIFVHGNTHIRIRPIGDVDIYRESKVPGLFFKEGGGIKSVVVDHGYTIVTPLPNSQLVIEAGWEGSDDPKNPKKYIINNTTGSLNTSFLNNKKFKGYSVIVAGPLSEMVGPSTNFKSFLKVKTNLETEDNNPLSYVISIFQNIKKGVFSDITHGKALVIITSEPAGENALEFKKELADTYQ